MKKGVIAHRYMECAKCNKIYRPGDTIDCKCEDVFLYPPTGFPRTDTELTHNLIEMRKIVAQHVGVIGALCTLTGISRADFLELAGAAWDEAHNTKDEG